MDYKEKYEVALNHARVEVLANPGLRKMWEEIFPELRESEDERMRKAALEGIEHLERNLGWDAIGDIDILDVKEYLEKQKEQKPVDLELIKRSWYMEGYIDGEFKREPMWNLVTGEGGPKYEKNEKYGQPLEQKPVEWSEEDKRALNDAIVALSMYANGEIPIILPSILLEDVERLKSLPEKFNIQPKQGWSEEDELMRKRCIADLGYLTEYEPQYKERYDTQIAWLKSLRPEPKGKWAKRLEEAQARWKPSEEQMGALRIVLEHEAERIGSSEELSLANSLYEQLKALL